MLNYFEVIERHIPARHPAHRPYVVHVTLVAQMALEVARRLKLGTAQLEFIEEAAMLHDIGIVNVDAPEIGCSGPLPYLCHLTEGERMLRAEGLPKHARVALTHVGVGGLTAMEIERGKLPLPIADLTTQTIEEQIVSYADCFFSKNPEKLWRRRDRDKVLKKAERYGPRQTAQMKAWLKEFGV